MKIELFDEIFEMENNKESVGELFDKIETIQEGGQYVLDCMEIDGTQIYENCYDYIIGNLKDIKEIKAVIISMDEMIRNILVSVLQYIEEAIPEISLLSDEFYKNPEQGTWKKLQQLIEGIGWINSGAELIVNSNKSSGEPFKYVKAVSGMKNKLPELEEAIKNSDMILIGDLLSYEIIPMLEAIKDAAAYIANSGDDKDEPN